MASLSHAQSFDSLSIDSQIAHHLAIIDSYTNNPGSVTAELALQAFSTIETIVNDREALDQIGLRTLVAIHQGLEDYVVEKPTHSKVAQVIVNFLGKEHKNRISKATIPKLRCEIERVRGDIRRDRENKKNEIGPIVERIMALPKREMKSALRTLLVDIHRGQFGHPVSTSAARDLILNHIPWGSELRDLLYDPSFFSVSAEVRELYSLPPEEARAATRALLIGLCQGQFGNPMTLQEATECVSKWAETISKELDYEECPIQLILADPSLFSLYECKTGRLAEAAPRDLGQCIDEKLQAGETTIAPPVNPDHTIQSLSRERLFRLNNLETVYQKTVEHPEERINSKFFPNTRAWYVGSTHRADIAPFELEMQRIGAEHHIPVITDSKLAFSQEDGVVLSFKQPQSATYPQDYVDFSQNEVRVPVVIDPKRVEEIQGKVQEARVERDPDWATRSIEGASVNPASQVFGIIGEPMGKALQEKAVDLASTLGATPVMNLTYSEGGNTLTGTKADGSMYVIIGQDSYVASKLLMEEDLGRPMSDQEVRMAFAIDYGVRIEDLYFIEQPGDFHLDMNIAIVGEKTVVVNDAIEAEKVFMEDNADILREQFSGQEEAIETRSKAASVQKKLFEDKAATDLENQGFHVIRSAGRFELQTPYGRRSKMNFYNMVTATTPEGKRIIIAMGVTKEEYKDRFRKMITSGGAAVDQIYFLNAEHTAQSLEMHGGISCRAKTI